LSAPAPPPPHPLPLPDALPIFPCDAPADGGALARCLLGVAGAAADDALAAERADPGFCGDTSATVERRVGRLLARMTLAEKLGQDRKSTRLNSSHRTISYAVFC